MNKIIPNSFINPLLEKNPYIALQTICSKYLEYHNTTLHLEDNQTDDNYGEAIKAYSIFYSWAKKWDIKVATIQLTANRTKNIDLIRDQANIIKGQAEKIFSEIALKEAIERTDALFGNIGSYEIGKDDLNNIQTSINAIRDLVSKTKELEKNHKERLIKRLDELQVEFDKKMTNFDKFWGFAIESRMYMSIMSKDAKPFLQNINIIVGIVANIMSISSGIGELEPSSIIKMLAS